MIFILNDFIEVPIKTNEKTIINNQIKYYPLENNYNLDNVEYLTINYKNREIISFAKTFIHNNNVIIFCCFENNKIINNIGIEEFYIIVNKLIKLTLKYITWYASFNKNYHDCFEDFEEIHRNEITTLIENINL
jgi:hypothetical protein